MMPEKLEGARIHLVGIKGTGMTALAQYLKRSGTVISGSDVSERFYTDEILEKEGIAVCEGFSPSHIPPGTVLLIHSAAYSPDINPELSHALKEGLPVITYPEALGELSKDRFCLAVSGVHGKTTTTAIIGTLVKELNLDGSVIAGSGVLNFDGGQVLYRGDEFLVAETCEYRRHFLNFHPNVLLVTSIQPDHLDYFHDYDDIFMAFCEYTRNIIPGGSLLCCREDSGASELATWAAENRQDIDVYCYGGDDGSYSLLSETVQDEKISFELAEFPGQHFKITVPGHHNVVNAAGAIASLGELLRKRYDINPNDRMEEMLRGMRAFRGTRRRSEVLFHDSQYIIMDDYAHHPTAIKTTLAGIRSFYPGKRLIVSFMSHTYSRTHALFEDFCSSLHEADIVVFHRIYASAREVKPDNSVEGINLYRRYLETGGKALYFDNPADALEKLRKTIKPGDLFITLGAGDNWVLSHTIAEEMEKKTS